MIYVGTSGPGLNFYNEAEVIPQGTATVPVEVSRMGGGKLIAYMAIKKGRQEWEPVSGKISLGDGPTVAQRPPTVQEAAGAAAQGKTLALANARFQKNRLGRNSLVVDCVLQEPLQPGKNYFLVVSGNSGTPIVSRLGISLMQAQVGDTEQIGISLMGPGKFPDGPLRIHVETRTGMRTSAGAVPVSNSVTLQR